MKRNNRYGTLAEATKQLKKRGYTCDFEISAQGRLEVVNGNDKRSFPPERVTLSEFHRFEGMTDPGDMSIIYALETDSGLKGTLVDAYGVYASESIAEFVNNVQQYRSKA